MKFTLSWLKTHLDTDADIGRVAETMTMTGLEVEGVEDPASALAAFSVARIVETAPHPNADRLRVCQVDTRDGRKEIVCGAPNARAGLTTIYAPVGAVIPASGVKLDTRAVRGVVSNGMLCSAAELEIAEESDGILELAADLPVGLSAADALGVEAVVDFEVTPNRPDWLGVEGIARDLSASGLGRRITPPPAPVNGAFPCPVSVRLDASGACPAFAGRLIRGVTNRPSPPWLQSRLASIGLRPINALVDVTNLICHDRARPLHVYDADRLQGGFVEARLGRAGETVAALDGRTYAVTPELCVIADASGAIGLGGVMGGESTGCALETRNVFIESAWFDPLRTAQTGRTTGISSDAQYRFARGVDPDSLRPGLELATQLILDLCGGEASDIVFAGEAPGAPAPVDFDPAYVRRLSGLALDNGRIAEILRALGFDVDDAADTWRVQPPSFRRDVQGRADLVEEVARIAGFDALPSEPLPPAPRAPNGVLTPRQARMRAARRFLAGAGYAEAMTWSFISQEHAARFGGGAAELVLDNPMGPDLACMRPSILPSLLEAVARNTKRGFGDLALFEIGPVYAGLKPEDQATAIAAVATADTVRRWDGGRANALFALKGDLLDLLDALGSPAGAVQIVQGANATWWHPGQSARIQLGPKTVLAEFGALHPGVLAALDAPAPVFAFELRVEALPEPKRKGVKTRPELKLSALMPLSRDFAFIVDEAVRAGDLVRAALSADRSTIADARIFDVYWGPGVPEGAKSVALEVVIQPTERTLTDAEIEAVSERVIQAAAKTCGARLRA